MILFNFFFLEGGGGGGVMINRARSPTFFPLRSPRGLYVTVRSRENKYHRDKEIAVPRLAQALHYLGQKAASGHTKNEIGMRISHQLKAAGADVHVCLCAVMPIRVSGSPAGMMLSFCSWT